MSVFQRKKDPSRLEGTELYDSEIKRFLQRVGVGGSSWWPGNDSLGKLFAWGEAILSERDKLKRDAAGLEGKFRNEQNKLQSQRLEAERRHESEQNRLLGQISNAEHRFTNDRKRFLAVEERNKTVEKTLRNDLLTAETRIRELQKDLADAQARLARLEEENATGKKQHREEVDNLKNKHTIVNKKEKDVHGREVKKLVGQLLVNQDDNLGWTDDKLKVKFQQLQNSINSLVSPQKKEYRIPPGTHIADHLDPTGFLVRTSRSNAYFLFQNTLWTILYEHFFATPFGLGVLGDDGTQKRILDVMVAWVEVLGKKSSENTPRSRVLEFFRQSKFTNHWRTATFQCINESLVATSGPQSPVATLIVANVDQAIARITTTLNEIARSSGTYTLGEGQEGHLSSQVQNIVLQARDLALQFGVHSAQLQLCMPEYGSKVEIGEHFYDCQDGDCDKGAKLSVSLVTLPGLQKVGDGRADMQSKRTLVPCEIYSE